MSEHDDAQVALLEAELADELAAEKALAARLLREAMEAREDLKVLTNTELTVAQYTAKGFENNEIGELLHMSRHTVQDYLNRGYRKLKLHSKLELAVLVAKAGLS